MAPIFFSSSVARKPRATDRSSSVGPDNSNMFVLPTEVLITTRALLVIGIKCSDCRRIHSGTDQAIWLENQCSVFKRFLQKSHFCTECLELSQTFGRKHSRHGGVIHDLLKSRKRQLPARCSSPCTFLASTSSHSWQLSPGFN